MTRYDVAIIGAGIAGSLLARQLRRRLPDLRVAIFDKAAPSYKVGESTVELASNYLSRRLGLAGHLYRRQLPKNGLRFFFDHPERDAPFERMSEIGSIALPHLPSFQLDRARFETDLWRMNQADGIDTIRGKVSRPSLDDPHRLQVLREGGKTKETITARWIVDASGRSGLFAKMLDLWQPDGHELAAVWGRMTGVIDVDDHGSAAFRARVSHTSRMLSTNHFCYPGYWIWLIPLAEGVTSVGVVMDRAQWRDEHRSAEGFLAFLRQHGALAELLADAELIDVMSYKQLAYGARRYLDASARWALTGEAAAFTDPLYSPGSDFIAIENDFITDLVCRDLAGEDIRERGEAYDGFLAYRFDTTMLLYRDLYRTLGSYELFGVKWDFDIGCYYNLWLEPYMRDQHLDLGWVKTELNRRRLVTGVLSSFRDLFLHVQGELEREGRFYRQNVDAFTGDFPTMRCAEGLGSDASARGALARAGEAFNLTRARALTLLGRAVEPPSLPIKHYLTGRSLLEA